MYIITADQVSTFNYNQLRAIFHEATLQFHRTDAFTPERRAAANSLNTIERALCRELCR